MLAASSMSASLVFGRADRMFSRIVSLGKNGNWASLETCSRSEAMVTPVTSWPSSSLLDGHDGDGSFISTRCATGFQTVPVPLLPEGLDPRQRQLARPEASDAESKRPRQMAHIHAVITDPTEDARRLRHGNGRTSAIGRSEAIHALARCFLRKPEVLLLDEPTENLDGGERDRLSGVIRDYAQRPDLPLSSATTWTSSPRLRIACTDNGGRTQSPGGRPPRTHREEGLYKRLARGRTSDPDLVYPRRSDPQIG